MKTHQRSVNRQASWRPVSIRGQRLLGPAIALGIAFHASVGLRADTLVPAGSTWRYLDDGSDPGSAWVSMAFDDRGWAAGPAQLGYGDGDEATVVRYGSTANDKYITTYFRLAFEVPDRSAYVDFTLSLLRDDGAVVYLNGLEVFRSNLPAGAMTYRTLASSSIGGSSEATFYTTTLASSNLVNGLNLLAVEVHQGATNSTDLSFDLALVGNRPPIVIQAASPSDGATEVGLDPALTASLPETPPESLSVSFYGRLAGPPPGPDFTLIALPDTQCYVASLGGGQPSTFTAQTDWIVSNQVARSIAFVTHLGDIVEHGDGGNSNEWFHATNAMYRLENPETTLAAHGIPYGVALGNHDFSTATNGERQASFYHQFFGPDHFAGRDYYGGTFGTNNHYELFSASGLDFIALHLEYQTTADTNVLAWANSLLQAHPERRAIVTSHYLLETGNPASFGGQGRAVYEALKGNPNFFLMLCGHVPGEGRRQDTFNNNTVHTLMSDYQGRTNGGSGWLRILEFSPSNNVIRVKTYSPAYDQYDTNASAQFTLPYDLRRGGSFSPLGTVTGIATATNVSLAWAGLAYATAYEWYAAVSDGTHTFSSPIQRFSTVSNTPPVVAVTRVTETPGGSGFLPAVTLAIEAVALDTDGAIRRVEFFADGTRLGEDAASPYSCAWTHVSIGAYYVTAVAVDNGGLCATSAPIRIEVSFKDQTPAPLAAPENLQATPMSPSQIGLAWGANAGTELGFVLERSLDGFDYTPIAVLGPEARAYADSGLAAATLYFYRVYAFNDAVASAYSEPASTATSAQTGGEFRLEVQLDRTHHVLWLLWPSSPGTVYRVVARDQVTDAAWADLSDEITATGPTAAWSEPLSTARAHRFYGVRVVR